MEEADECDESLLCGVVPPARGEEVVRSTSVLVGLWGVGVGVEIWVVVLEPEWSDPLVADRGTGSVVELVVESDAGLRCLRRLGEGPEGASKSERHSPSSSMGSLFGSTLCRAMLVGSELVEVAAAC